MTTADILSRRLGAPICDRPHDGRDTCHRLQWPTVVPLTPVTALLYRPAGAQRVSVRVATADREGLAQYLDLP